MLQRSGPGVVQVEDDQLRASSCAFRRARLRPIARRRTGDAEAARRGLDLRGEHEVVEDGEYHWTIMIVESQAVGPLLQERICRRLRGALAMRCSSIRATKWRACSRSPRPRSWPIRHILLTHAHVDHVTGVAAAKRALNVPVYLHRDDLFLYERAVESGVRVRAARRAAAADRRLTTRRNR